VAVSGSHRGLSKSVADSAHCWDCCQLWAMFFGWFSSWMYLQTRLWVAMVFAVASLGYGVFFFFSR